MSIATKRGDKGYTGLASNDRVRKDNDIIDVIGNVDELNCFIGLIDCDSSEYPSVWKASFQDHLFRIGSDLAVLTYRTPQFVEEKHLTTIENILYNLESELPSLSAFILPGGHAESAKFHAARAICRRAERSFISMFVEGEECGLIAKYLNRLSDVLFQSARYVNMKTKVEDVIWKA